MAARDAARRTLKIIAIGGMLLIALVAILLIVTQTPWFRQRLEGILESQASRYLRGDLEVGRIGGNLITGITLHEVSLTQDGQPVIAAEAIASEYQPLDLLRGDLALGSIVVDSPVVHVRQTAEGLNLTRLIEPRPSASRGPDAAAPLVAIDEIVVRNGTVTIGAQLDEAIDQVNLPARATDLDARVAITRPPGRADLALQIDGLSFRAHDPALTVTEASGRVAIGESRITFDDLAVKTLESSLTIDGTIGRGESRSIDMDVRAANLSLPELAPLVPALASRTLSPAFEVSAEGTLARMDVDLHIKTNEGEIDADVRIDAAGSRRGIEGMVAATDLNLDAIDRTFEESDITAGGRIDLAYAADSGLSGEYQLQAPELAYGRYRASEVSAEGHVDGRTLAVDAQASAYGGRIRAEGTITLPDDGEPAAYDLHGEAVSVDLERATADLNAEALKRAVSGDGSTPATLEFHLTGGQEELDVDVRVNQLTLAGTTFAEGTTVDVGRANGRLTYAIEGRVTNLDLQALGSRFDVAALSAPRYASDLDATLDVEGSGTTLPNLTLHGSALLTDSRLFGGAVPRARVGMNIVEGGGTFSVEGRFADVTLARVLDRPSPVGRVSGTVDLEGRVSDLGEAPFSFGSLEAAGTITLADSTIAGIPIRTAGLSGRYDDGVATIALGEMQGPDLEAKISGRLALDRDHESDLTYCIDTPPLAEVALIDAPVHGEVVLNGHLTGNLARFHTEGTLSGVALGYGDTSALGLHSRYALTVPDLEFARLGGSATSELTSLSIAGRTITEVKVTTSYDAGQVAFDALVREAGRTLDAGGRLAWHPDHQEIHLDRLGLSSGAAEWQLADDTSATVRYGGDRLVIEGLVLRGGGDGRIALDGTLGPGAGPLEIEVTSLDLAEVDRLLLGQRDLAGQLNVSADLSGAMAAPDIEGRFSLTEGAFEAFTFESFGGTFEYERRSLLLDARLVASDGSWVTVDGRVPFAPDVGPLDVSLKSSQIALGLIQGFTDELTDVAGMLRLDFTATGSYADPHLSGYADVDGGAFTVVAGGTRYTGLDTRIRFEPDVVHIEEFRVLDDDGDPMRVGGELGVHDREIGGLDLTVESRSFELMDNPLGEIEVDMGLRVSGEPAHLRVGGRVELASGQLRVDRILDLLDTEYELEPAPGNDPAAARFTIATDVRVAVPDNLVLTGTDIQAPGGTAPTGLGDLNLTIGGDLRLTKDPGEELEMLGDVHPVRGTYEFQGREFEIQRDGAIVFVGTPEINPTLDLLATRLIAGVEARVRVAGTLRAPRLELSSQPPLDDSDILSLIVFNRPVNQLGAGEQISLAQRAASIAAGFVGSQITSRISEALELDVFDIEVGSATTPAVVIGEQFARGVFLKFRQQFGPQAASSVLLEYEVTDWLRLRSEISQAQTATRSLFDRSELGSVKLVFRFRH